MFTRHIVTLLIKYDSFKDKPWHKLLSHILYMTIMLVGVPFFYIFEVCYVLPVVVDTYSMSYYFHVICSTFIFINIVSNMVYTVLTNTSIQGKLLRPTFNKKGWTFCSTCEVVRPPRAWHCDFCNTCILKRDHHCTFLATCIGYHNYRYFMLLTFYIFLGMVYAFYFNVWCLAKVIKWNDKWIVLKFLFPLVSASVDPGQGTFYISVFVFNVLLGLYTGTLLFFHLDNLLSGCTTPERKVIGKNFYWSLLFHNGPKDFSSNSCNKGLKLNLVEALGSRWYLTWISPFVSSPLPGNGICWPTSESKGK